MDYEYYRFGSAATASTAELKHSNIIDGKGISFGFDNSRQYELRVPTDGSVALFAGAGAGKSASAFVNALIAGHMPGNFICFDPRGELATVSMLALSLQGYKVYFINPTDMHGLPSHKTNPLDHLRLTSPSLIADTQKMALDLCPTPKGVRTSWSYDDARRWLTEISLYDTERYGCSSPAGIYELLLTMSDLDLWCEHLEKMLSSRFVTVRAFAEEIMRVQQEGRESYTAPLSVLQNTFAYMRDPRLQETFSGSDFSLEDVCDPNQKIAVFLLFPFEYLKLWAPAIRQCIGKVIQSKLRNPSGFPVSVLVDEAGQLGYFVSIIELFTFGRGAGLVSNMVAWQEIAQIRDDYGEQADAIIGSAQFRVFKGVRTEATANLVSKMAGTMTLEYDAVKEQSDARRLKQQAAMRMLSGGDFFEEAANLRHYQAAETHRTKQPRKVLEPDEVMNMPPSMMVAFASGVLTKPILGHWVNHFERSDLAGKYLNNPFHGELVTIKTRFGSQKRRIIEERVPDALAHLPQYQGGTWRYVEGYRPNIT